MISLINTIVKEKIPGLKNAEFSFLKYSTPTSGTTLDDKVLFFVFKDKGATPFLCVKTVRNYGAKETITRVFNNLKKLNDLTSGSAHSRLFAKALYLHDDGENIFSIETVCPGKRVKTDLSLLEIVMPAYCDFQQYLAEKGKTSLTFLEQFAEEIVAQSGISKEDTLEIKNFFGKLSFSGAQLPRLIQHGDVTGDNLLISKEGLCIVDCDSVGLIDLPGFDLFGLFYRYDPTSTKDLCCLHLPGYFARIGGKVEKVHYDMLFFLYFFIERVIRKSYLLEHFSAKRFVADFKQVFEVKK